MLRGPTAGATSASAASSAKAFTVSSTASYGPVIWSTVTSDGRRVTSPCGLRICSPFSRNCAARFGRTRNVTSRPASASRPPKYPPVAPTPTTRIRMDASLAGGDRNGACGGHLHYDINGMQAGHASVKASHPPRLPEQTRRRGDGGMRCPPGQAPGAWLFRATRCRRYTRSKIAAIPWPPPMHIVTSA